MKTVLNKKELDRLAEVIAEQELKTSGEIRLMLVGRSIQTGHVFPVLWLGLLSLSLLTIWYERMHFVVTAEWWMVPVVMLVTFLLALGLSRLEFVQRRLTMAEDLLRQVWTRAELEFHREGLSQTEGRTGILIFVSLLEHQAVVLADRQIAQKLKPEVWVDVVQKVIEGARTGQWPEKLEEALRLCGAVLSEHFPGGHGDKNELPNHVIIKP